MRKGAVIALAVTASFVLAASATAESGVKEECVTPCKAAAKFIDEKGLDAGIAEIGVAKTKGEGWTEYRYPKPEELKKPTPFKEKKSSKKISYVYRIPGKDLMVIAGFFD